MHYVLDRFEGDTAIFVGDDESIVSLPGGAFAQFGEGDVFDSDGGSLVFNLEETITRRRSTRARFERLKRRKFNNNGG